MVSTTKGRPAGFSAGLEGDAKGIPRGRAALVINLMAYGRSMVITGDVQVSTWAGLFFFPKARSTVILMT
jgi:hypothetical protein